MCKGSKNLLDTFTNLNLCAVADEFGRCAALGDVVQKRIDKLFIRLDRVHIRSTGLSTNEKLSRGNATIDCWSVGVDGIGSHWFIMRMHVQGRIRRLVSFLEYSTHGHACELSSTLERLLDGVNRQPTETRVKLSVVRFRSHDKLRSCLYCLMVTNVMSTTRSMTLSGLSTNCSRAS
jgi:hypothetical protein